MIKNNEIIHGKVADVNNWRWPNFTPNELRCRETGIFLIQESFLDVLQSIRFRYAKPMIITSGFRSVNHSIEKKKLTIGSHPLGMAVDIGVRGEPCLRLIKIILDEPMLTGLGVSQKSNIRFIHLDTIPIVNSWGLVRPNIWSY